MAHRLSNPLRKRSPDSASPADASVTLADLRNQHGITQADLAEELDLAARMLEGRRAAEPRLSTLRRYVEGIGHRLGSRAQLRIVAVIGDTEHALGFPPRRAGRARIRHDREGQRDETKQLLTPRRPGAFGHGMTLNLSNASSPTASSRYERRRDRWASTDWPTEIRLRQRHIARASPDRTPQAIGMFVGYWRAFRVEMEIGDIVVVPLLGRRVAIGEVSGAYTYRADELNPRLRHRR